ncbi:hypothetical protein HQ393_12295 [Chitinibacter bivalviorum]|uniref:Uncharacterized protein n=1 Tax=Chitinibacter bivalviorum TaxID=2739434 RepID=A0A7H9BKQ0_9NEIS|nr:hypothetical protein [Chitinibacter bivalviorum]QLG88952.1 hypothetical protein HQ393_12295 [Chitinibacter bivalviorum]
MPTSPEFISKSTDHAAVELVLRQAKRCQRLANTGSISAALPILRRLINAGAVAETSLTVLFRQRATLQRKHFLRMLALEAGLSSWELLRPHLLTLGADDLAHFQWRESEAGKLNLWFATPEAAAQYVQDQGGRLVKVGTQALVLSS